MRTRLYDKLRNRALRTGNASHWSRLTERGYHWGLRFSAFAYRVFGRTGCMVILCPVVLYFFLSGSQQRQASRSYLSQLMALPPNSREATWVDGYRHFLAFAGGAEVTLAAWSGHLSSDALSVAEDSDLRDAEQNPDGALFIVTHLGNADLSRALLDDTTRARLTILVHTKHAVHYNDVLHRYNPAVSVNTLQVTELGPETMIDLQKRIDHGEWVVIAGDRTPVGSQERVTRVPFLGKEAPFAQGPYILASLLRCPVYLLFCLRSEHGYKLYVEKFADQVTLPRQNREKALLQYTERFANRLEHHVIKAPFQWYNFFDFWA